MKRIKKIIIIGVIVIGLLIGVSFLTSFLFKDKFIFWDNAVTAYLSSSNEKVLVYDLEYNELELPRGISISLYETEVTKEDGTIYKKFKYRGKEYLVGTDNVVNNYEESIKEKEMYVRTSVTTYKNSIDVDIAGFIKKGTKLDVIGFDTIDENGKVNMYKVKDGEKEVFVYSKYLVKTLDEASAVYNENGTHDIHKDRAYSFELYGGYAKNLDYYPYEKPSFENNKLIAESKTYYLVGTYYVLAEIDKYINLAKSAGADAFVVDIKDGALAYDSEVAKEYSMSSYNSAMNSKDFYGNAIKKLKDAGFYVIGRIVLFNDSKYANDNPDDCIKTSWGTNTTWVSAYSRRAWEYNVKLAKEAIELFDFNEIQFDYVRFPEASYNWSKNGYDFRNTYNEEKAEAVQNFLMYAADEIHKDEVYVSADVFGECSDGYVTAYGQYWPAISNIVDVISSMPYTDHFDRNNSSYWTNPYNTLKTWGTKAAKRQTEIPTPAGVRTWITAYNTPYWNVTTIYGANEIAAQIQGLKDAGLGTGFITWNGVSSYAKYQEIAPAFSRTY